MYTLRQRLETAQAILNLFQECQKADTKVQSVICSKEVFSSAKEAAKWVKSHGFRTDKVDETTTSYRFRQMDPGSCQEGSFRTIKLTDGVSAVICKPKKAG